MPMVAISVTTSASTRRKPLFCGKRISSDVGAGDNAAPDQRYAEKQLQPDGRTDNLGQVAGGNRYLAQDPKKATVGFE